MKNGPELWNKVIAEVEKAFPVAIIAGGAPRDYLMGRRAKDIDVFVYTPDGSDFWTRSRKLKFTKPLETDPREYTALDELISVTSGNLFGQEVQVIGVNMPDFSPAALTGRFDFGICRVVYVEPKEILVTLDAARDMANHTVTLVHAPAHRRGASLQRAVRFATYWPDFTLLEADGSPLIINPCVEGVVAVP